MEVRFAQSAFDDLQTMMAWYADEGVPEIGVKFAREIMTRVQGLSGHPDLGRMVPEFRQPHIREVIHPPFRVVYWREADVLTVVRVWRSERLLVLPVEY